MECHQCQASNSQGKRFFGDCGALLDPKEFLDVRVRQQVDEALADRFRDQELVEVKVTESIATKLLGWAKIYASIVGSLVALAALVFLLLGYKNLQDVQTKSAEAKKAIGESLDADLKTFKDNAETKLNAAQKNAEDIQKHIDAAQQQAVDVERSISQARAIKGR